MDSIGKTPRLPGMAHLVDEAVLEALGDVDDDLLLLGPLEHLLLDEWEGVVVR